MQETFFILVIVAGLFIGAWDNSILQRMRRWDRARKMRAGG